jgi:hypothetical protein
VINATPLLLIAEAKKKEEVAAECRAEPYSLDEVEKMGFEYIEDEEVKKVGTE